MSGKSFLKTVGAGVVSGLVVALILARLRQTSSPDKTGYWV